MPPTHILILIHGMTTVTESGDHSVEYADLWAKIVARRPALASAFDARIQVEWGHRPRNVPPGGLRDDQQLTDAENFISEQVRFANVHDDPSPQNHVLGFGAELFSKFVTRHVTDPIKETVEVFGITDVLYYCSAEGEAAVRAAVYTQVLAGLEPLRGHADVRLHVVAHSLGVTVAHDSLFGLFAPEEVLTGGAPGFLTNTKAPPEARDQYAFWRGRAREARTLTLASKSRSASQLPLFAMRKQALVNQLAGGQRLDPTVIGLPPNGPVKWKLFYDVDDILGFPTRRLYQPTSVIEEFQVDTDWRPNLAHTAYWANDKVAEETAKLLEANLP
jgi:hypothetical protein